MKLLAYGLTADYQGDTTVERDGESETVPKFQGGVLAVGGADFHVADTLAEHGGAIVVYERDRELVDVLDQYPALKQVTVPAGVQPVNPYDRHDRDTLRHLASLRDFEGHGNSSRDELALLLEAHDVALAEDYELAPKIASGDRAAVARALARVIEQTGAAGRDVSLGDPGDTSGDDEPDAVVGDLTTPQLVAVLDNDTKAFEDAGRVEVPAAIDELRRRASHADDEGAAAFEALHAHNLTEEG